jgi:signal transduction histidine kinase
MDYTTYTGAPGKKTMSLSPGKMPDWKTNLAVFGALILIVLGYFFWQAEKAQQSFYKRVADHSQMLAGMITFSLDNSNISQKALEKIIHSFLDSTAEFIDYLETVAPFTSGELASFAEEAGLAGISILRVDGIDTEGPPGWSPPVECQPTASSLTHYPESSLYLLTWPRSNEPGCILVGYDATDAEKLKERIGVNRLLQDLNKLPLIKYVRLEKNTTTSSGSSMEGINLLLAENNNVAEARMEFKGDTLVVGIEADKYIEHIRQLWLEFILFSVILAGLGLFFSWLLNRYQVAFLERVRGFERQMAHQHEEAALGRAAAIISHEIKNPLNAISMGLQRLKIETTTMSPDHQGLVDSMLQAVSRTNHIVSDLKRHTQPINPKYKKVLLHNIIEAAMTLYQQETDERNIAIRYNAFFQGEIEADESLLGQAIENLLKNGIEAQPHGGYIDISLSCQDDTTVLVIENSGLAIDASEVKNIMEPYFTTKTKGTGLGLAISRRIIEAHHGIISLEVPSQEVLRVIIKLPCRKYGKIKI